jgi:hypothetical protein
MTTAAASIIETTDNRTFRVVADLGAQFDCIEVKRAKGEWADKKNARPMLVLKTRIIKTVRS